MEKMTLKQAESYKDLLGARSLLMVDKEIDNFEEFINSEELKKVFEGFQAKTSLTKNSFRKAFVVGDKVYTQYEADGINFFRREKVGTCIDNYGLDVVLFASNVIFIVTRNYDKGEANRKIFRSESFTDILTNSTTY